MCHTWRAKEGRGKAKFDDGRQQGRGRVSETRARGVENTPVTGQDGRKRVGKRSCSGMERKEEGETATTQVDP
jgi:hypothetical protein